MKNVFMLSPVSVNSYGCKLISDLSPHFKKHPNRGICKLDYSGLGISIKTSRVSDKENFWMNFQQLRFEDECKVYIFIGFFEDENRFWLFKPDELINYVSNQHPGGVEFQLGITNKNIDNFQSNEFKLQDIVPYLDKYSIS